MPRDNAPTVIVRLTTEEAQTVNRVLKEQIHTQHQAFDLRKSGTYEEQTHTPHNITALQNAALKIERGMEASRKLERDRSGGWGY
jgi:hypothetical protein